MNERAASLSQHDIVALLVSNDVLQRQVEWFKRQLFGEKSERRIMDPGGRQLFLGEEHADIAAPDSTESVAAYPRRKTVVDVEVHDSEPTL